MKHKNEDYVQKITKIIKTLFIIASLFYFGAETTLFAMEAPEVPFSDVLPKAFANSYSVVISHQWISDSELSNPQVQSIIVDFFRRNGKLIIIQQDYNNLELMNILFLGNNLLGKKFGH